MNAASKSSNPFQKIVNPINPKKNIITSTRTCEPIQKISILVFRMAMVYFAPYLPDIKMLDICNSFADMDDIKFNAEKSLGIKFGGQPVTSEVLYLGKSRIEWVSSVEHLCNYVNSDVTDKTDCDMKCFSLMATLTN